MKKILGLLFILGGLPSAAQIFKPVTVGANFEKTSNTEGVITLTAEIDEGWHVYARDVKSPIIPTAIRFNDSIPEYELDGELLVVTQPKRKFDDIFQMEVGYWTEKAIFKQKVKHLSRDKAFPITASFSYQCCNDKSCLPPSEVVIQLPQNGFVKKDEPIALEENPLLIPNLDLKNPVSKDCVQPVVAKHTTYWGFFILGFLGGLLALVTPCVFPMIPLTVSFFTQHSKNHKRGVRNAILYGFFILSIYLLLSLPFHLMQSIDPEILNRISTSVGLNLFFFVIFVFFALSFFGYYELRIPGALADKADSASHIKGLVGIFFMALTLAIVSFSCTGPILGSLLAGSLSSDGGAWQLTAGMGGFGLALALPFALFALSPKLLQSLPKSGSWLNTVKVVLGFIELALALKFLSNADLVAHWGILPREVFIGLWVLIFILSGLYLFGKITFPHDLPKPKISTTRAALGVIFLAFTAYLSLGLWDSPYKNLSLISGFPPPLFYSVYPQKSKCPLGISCFKDFDAGMAHAKKLGKPVMLDFTGWACVNCRRMEENVWCKPAIFKLLRDDYVLISLYVDDRKELPADSQFSFKTQYGTIKKVRTSGEKWAKFETENFHNNSQPWYVLLSPTGQLLTHPVGYTPSAAEYKRFLACGLQAYQKVK
ncbi:MAG: cytochrome c biogenesis protein CcdA [Flavobacteriales bacterium]